MQNPFEINCFSALFTIISRDRTGEGKLDKTESRPLPTLCGEGFASPDRRPLPFSPVDCLGALLSVRADFEAVMRALGRFSKSVIPINPATASLSLAVQHNEQGLGCLRDCSIVTQLGRVGSAWLTSCTASFLSMLKVYTLSSILSLRKFTTLGFFLFSESEFYELKGAISLMLRLRICPKISEIYE